MVTITTETQVQVTGLMSFFDAPLRAVLCPSLKEPTTRGCPSSPLSPGSSALRHLHCQHQRHGKRFALLSQHRLRAGWTQQHATPTPFHAVRQATQALAEAPGQLNIDGAAAGILGQGCCVEGVVALAVRPWLPDRPPRHSGRQASLTSQCRRAKRLDGS